MNQSVIPTPTHEPFSPSGFKRKKLCAGSHLAEQKYDNVSGEAAIDGTHTHTLVETCIVHDKSNANEYIGTKLIDHEGEFEIKADRVERANMALTYVQNQVDSCAYPVIVGSEERLDPGSLIFRNDWAGSGDITLVAVEDYEGEEQIVAENIQWMNVIDYKDGGQPVDPFENYQGVSYMLGLIAIYNPPFNTPIRFTIIQPKAGGIKEWDTTVGELMNTWLPDCEQVINDCLDPNAPRVAGEEQCHYCLHRKKCKERNKTAINGVNKAMGALPAVIDFTGEAIVVDEPPPMLAPTLPVITEMSNTHLGEILLLVGIVRGWFKDIAEEAEARVLAGQTIPWHKLVQKNGRRAWQPEHDDIIKALLAMTVDKKRIFRKDDIIEEKLISFTKVLGNPSLTVKQKERIEKEFLKQPHGQKALVLETEKGDDISPAKLLGNADMPVVTMVNSTEA